MTKPYTEQYWSISAQALLRLTKGVSIISKFRKFEIEICWFNSSWYQDIAANDATDNASRYARARQQARVLLVPQNVAQGRFGASGVV